MPSVDEVFAAATGHHQAGRLKDAEGLYRQILASHPSHTDSLHRLGLIARDTGHFDIAAALFTRVLDILPDAAESHHALAYTLHAHGKFELSAARFARALALDPANAKIHNNLGNLHKDRGDFAAALACYEQALVLEPDFAWAHYNRADLHRFTPGDGAGAALARIAAMNLPPEDAVYIHFAAAKAMADTGDRAASFAHLAKGNALKRGQITYDEAAVLAEFGRIATAFTPALLRQYAGAGNPSTAPIFIVGMPRAGSTLIEQILSRHSQVYAAGERSAFDHAVNAVLAPSVYPDGVASQDHAAVRHLGDDYLARMPGPGGKARITDKMPGNFRYLGLIHMALPGARIIHAVRDPVDTCLSCFSKLFSEGQAFSYDLGELGRYTRAYAALMDHWRAVLPAGVMIDVAYEDVVGDLEGQARRMVAHCGLAWDERCLAFHEGARAVETASAVQVRQPLYATSVRRWRDWEPFIGPLREALEHRAEKWNPVFGENDATNQ